MACAHGLPAWAQTADGAAGEIAAAGDEARQVMGSSDMEEIRMHLQRAANCLVGSDSGSYHGAAGTPCQEDGATPQTDDAVGKKRLDDAATDLLADCNQGRIEDAHRYAKRAIALLGKVG